MRRFFITMAVAAAALADLSAAVANEAVPSAVRVFPPDAKLKTSRDRQAFIVQAVYPDGITRDLTHEAKFTLADDKIARLEGSRLSTRLLLSPYEFCIEVNP